MDPFSAISLTGSIVQFIDFACKVVSGAIEISKSAVGTRKECEELELIVNDIQAMHVDLISQNTSDSLTTSRIRREKALYALQNDCISIASELQAALDKLKVSGSHRKWKNTRSALMHVLKQEKIDELEKRLLKAQRQIDSHIISDVRKQQGKVMKVLDELASFSVASELKRTEELRTLINSVGPCFESLSTPSTNDHALSNLVRDAKQRLPDLWMALEAIEQSHRRLNGIVGAREAAELSKQQLLIKNARQLLATLRDVKGLNPHELSRDVEELRRILTDLARFYDMKLSKHTALREMHSNLIGLMESIQRAKNLFAERRILSSLDYETRKARQSEIKKAHEKTFEWIFADSVIGSRPITFIRWLKHQSGIYWISGRPGSGKSTLMKYLYSHRKTMKALELWAGTHKLITASYFFWNSGTPMQRSLNGLLRSLLVQVLDQCPELIPIVFPGHWQESLSAYASVPSRIDWDTTDLLDAFSLITKQNTLSSKFCFFIDGLDEYGGRDREIVKLVGDLNTSPFLKFCLASRPHVEFRNTYGSDPSRVIYVHDLTEGDIKLFVQTTLGDNEKFGEFKTEAPSRCQQLIDDIVAHANGVFLWVHLVVLRLLEGIEVNQDRISDLERKLQRVPKELNQLFQHILDDVDEDYRDLQAQMFQIACHADEPLDLMAYHFLDIENEDITLRKAERPMKLADVETTQSVMRVRVDVRCKGLLEVVEDRQSPMFSRLKVTFLHRTVRDFLIDKEMQGFLEQRISFEFNPLLSICKAILAETAAFVYDQGDSIQESQHYRLLDTLVHYAEEMELTQDTCPITILDEALHVLSSLPRLEKGAYQWTRQTWVSLMRLQANGAGSERALLELASERGLVHYVRHQLDKCPHLLRHVDGLLHSALSPSFPTNYERVLNPAMVQFLLNKGADPNPCFDMFLENLRVIHKNGKATCNRDLAKASFYVLKEMLEHGAGSSVLGLRSKSRESAVSLADSLFEKQDALRIEDIVASKSKKTSNWLGTSLF